jgi:hypothetical protein
MSHDGQFGDSPHPQLTLDPVSGRRALAGQLRVDKATLGGAMPVSPRGNSREAKTQARLSINLGTEAAEFLEEVTAKKGISYTEAVRRGLALLKLVEDASAAGKHVQIDDGEKIRELIVL